MTAGRVLVTGGGGFIGAAIVRRLGGRAIVAEGDLTRPGALDGALDAVDAVVHLAARSGGVQLQESVQQAIYDENTEITANVLAACAKVGVPRVFLASSGVVYAADSPALIPEDGPLVRPQDTSGYAWSKLTDEALGTWHAHATGSTVLIGRFTNIYGPGGSFEPQRSTVVHALVKRAVEAPDGVLGVWGDGTAVRSFLYVDDAAEAVVTLVERGEPGVYNLDAAQPVSVGELAALVRDAVDPGLDLVFDSSKPSGPPRRALDASRLRGLGFAPSVPLPEGIARTVASYRSTSG